MADDPGLAGVIVRPDIARQVAREPWHHGRYVVETALAVLLVEVETAEARRDEDRRLREAGDRL